MNTNTKKTIKDWDALNAAKLAELEQLKAKKSRIDAERADAILRVGEFPADNSAKKDLENIEKKRQGLAVEIESIEALLTAIPERRRFAQADELEANLEEVEAVLPQLSGCAAKIDGAAETLVLAVGEFYAELAKIFSITNEIGGNLNIFSYNIGVLDSIGVALRKHDLYKYIKVGNFRYPETVVETISKHLTGDIIRFLYVERQKTLMMRGEIPMKPDVCPNCFGDLELQSMYSNDRRCLDCKTVFKNK